MKIVRRISSAILAMAVSLPVLAGDPVGITPNLMSVTGMHNGAATEIVRNQDNCQYRERGICKDFKKMPAILYSTIFISTGR